MPLDQDQFSLSLTVLFDSNADPGDDARMLESAHAFQNLVMHFVEVQAVPYKGLLLFDNIKLVMMLKRFYRDAFGVGRFAQKLQNYETAGQLQAGLKETIMEDVSLLSIRINSGLPRKTRIAAAFSLWMATFRPLFLKGLPSVHKERAWRFDATINFWIATRFLRTYGEIVIGDPVKKNEDFKARLKRIYHDLTYRDVNLSSLEVMYAFIFKPY